MIRPALLALLTPILVGLAGRYVGENKLPGDPMLGVEVLAAFLMFGTLTGLMMAIFLGKSHKCYLFLTSISCLRKVQICFCHFWFLIDLKIGDYTFLT
jgi:hypothetical protein